MARKTSTRARAKAPPTEVLPDAPAKPPAQKRAKPAQKKSKRPPAKKRPKKLAKAHVPVKPAPARGSAPLEVKVPFELRAHPDPELAVEITILAAVGTPHRIIAGQLGISTKTLHEHYKPELTDGAERANAVVGSRIYVAAASGVEWAAKLWAAKRLGWTEAPKKTELTVRRIAFIAPDTPMPEEDDDEAFLADDEDSDEDEAEG